jgi:very-short-patch-repair endonuclease
MRRYFTTKAALRLGITHSALRWGEQTGQWRRIRQGVWRHGASEPDALDVAIATVLRGDGIARGHLAGVLHELDSVELRDRPSRRRALTPDRVVRVAGIRCADGLQTLIDIAPTVTDATWEQALESALRKQLTSIDDLEPSLRHFSAQRAPGIARVRRVLDRRPAGAPPTESLLETLMVQLARRVDRLPDPSRQVRVEDALGGFVARVDLAWPELGVFIELDGEHHKHQPVHDANRETAVVAATGWLCGRFTWTEVVHSPTSTARRLAAIVEQARRRPIAS